MRIPCDCTKGEIENKTLEPGESTKVSMEVTTDYLLGFTVKSIYLQLEGSEEELRLYISTEIKE
jgi:hypothetical protein